MCEVSFSGDKMLNTFIIKGKVKRPSCVSVPIFKTRLTQLWIRIFFRASYEFSLFFFMEEALQECVSCSLVSDSLRPYGL